MNNPGLAAAPRRSYDRPMNSTVRRLHAFAERRVQSPPGALLLPQARRIAADPQLLSAPLVPWQMSIGHNTPLWADLDDEEKLACNHWLYYLHYLRIADGEAYGIVAGEVVAAFLEPHAPTIAALLLRENDEEHDHIAAFDTVRARVAEGWGFAHLCFPRKPLRRVFVDPRFVRRVVDLFGGDYVVVHFLARGIINHMGKGFERSLASHADSRAHALSAMHVEDENQHLAASHMLAAAGLDLSPSPKQGQLMHALRWTLHRTAVWSLFSEGLTKRQEASMTRLAFEAMPVFARRDPAFLDALIAEHFAGCSGVEEAKNDFIAAPNKRIVSRAALSPSARANWVRWMRQDQGNLRHFPDGYDGHSETLKT